MFVRGQILLASLEFLGQPVTGMGALHGPSKGLWLGEQVTEILPDQVIKLAGRDEAGRTLFG